MFEGWLKSRGDFSDEALVLVCFGRADEEIAEIRLWRLPWLFV